jgi:hypothetical protein
VPANRLVPTLVEVIQGDVSLDLVEADERPATAAGVGSPRVPRGELVESRSPGSICAAHVDREVRPGAVTRPVRCPQCSSRSTGAIRRLRSPPPGLPVMPRRTAPTPNASLRETFGALPARSRPRAALGGGGRQPRRPAGRGLPSEIVRHAELAGLRESPRHGGSAADHREPQPLHERVPLRGRMPSATKGRNRDRPTAPAWAIGLPRERTSPSSIPRLSRWTSNRSADCQFCFSTKPSVTRSRWLRSWTPPFRPKRASGERSYRRSLAHGSVGRPLC